MIVIPGGNIVAVEKQVIRDDQEHVWIPARLYVHNIRATHHRGMNLTEFSRSQAASRSQSRRQVTGSGVGKEAGASNFKSMLESSRYITVVVTPLSTVLGSSYEAPGVTMSTADTDQRRRYQDKISSMGKGLHIVIVTTTFVKSRRRAVHMKALLQHLGMAMIFRTGYFLGVLVNRVARQGAGVMVMEKAFRC